jgi:cytochrome c oxidase subunit III
VIRVNHPPWPPPGFPVLPHSLWLSTLVIIASSFTAQWALRDARADALAGMRRWLTMTFMLGLAFLALQAWAWWQIVAQVQSPSQNAGPYLKLFYVLTGLHAAHVIGGLIPLGAVTRRAFAGRYSATYHPGVQYCAIYWHFLDAVWCAMFVVVYLI